MPPQDLSPCGGLWAYRQGRIMHKYKVGDEFTFNLNGKRRTITGLKPDGGYTLRYEESIGFSTCTESFIDKNYTPIKKERSMAEFKYEVEDEFTYDGDRKRAILARYKSTEGENRYVVRYEEDPEDEILPEEYITRNYKKIEPFFEVDKKYHYVGSSEKSWTCHVVTEVLGEKIALMTYGESKDPTTFQQHEFSHYREV